METPSASYRHIVRSRDVRGWDARVEGTRIGVHDVIGLIVVAGAWRCHRPADQSRPEEHHHPRDLSVRHVARRRVPRKGVRFISIGNDLHHILTQAGSYVKNVEGIAVGGGTAWARRPSALI